MARLPANWMQDHIDRYLKTNGADGHMWNGVPTLLLTTTGRQTGESRLLPLIYGTRGDDYIIVASKGGNPKHPAWYLNLRDNPQVHIQVKDQHYDATCRTVEGEERAECWAIMEKIFPTYNQYAAATTRHIPVVVISPN